MLGLDFWEWLIIICAVIHFVSISCAVFGHMQRVVSRNAKIDKREMNSDKTFNMKSSERILLFALLTIDMVVSVSVAGVAMWFVQKTNNYPHEWSYVAVLCFFAIVLVMALAIYIFRKKIERISMREIPLGCERGLLLAEMLAFSVLIVGLPFELLH